MSPTLTRAHSETDLRGGSLANDSNGQIGVSGSNAATIINSPYSTGQNMIVKNGDTKGVTGGKTSGGGLFGNSAVGNWWQKLATAAVSFFSIS